MEKLLTTTRQKVEQKRFSSHHLPGQRELGV